jgi:putative Mg2+ transporter-C (MgtC) family protein
VTGAIGAAVGLGSYDVAVVLTLVTIATLWIMSPLKRLGHLADEEQEAANAERKPQAQQD